MFESFWLSMKKPNLERQVVPVDNSSNCVTTSHNVSVAEVFFIFFLFLTFFCGNQTYPRQSQRAGRIRRTLRIPPSTPLPGWSLTSRSECSGHRSYYMYTIKGGVLSNFQQNLVVVRAPVRPGGAGHHVTSAHGICSDLANKQGHFRFPPETTETALSKNNGQ